MNKKILNKLNYYEIKENIKQHTLSDLGKKQIDKLFPSTDYKIVQQRLNKTEEAVNILNQGSNIPMYGLASVDDILEKCDRGIVLKPEELLQIADFLRGCKAVKKFMSNYEYIAPVLCSYALVIDTCEELETEISNMIVGSGIRKDATSRLNKLNRLKKVTEENIEMRLNKFLNSKANKNYLQDTFISKRNNTFVIPVKATYKNKVEGRIIEESATRSTVFIEPKVIEKLTAELAKINIDIEEEHYQILASLTGFVQMYYESLVKNIEVMTEYDFTFAKAKYSIETKSIKPELTKEEIIVIKKGRHPELGKEAVPLDFEIGKDYRTLMVTGPNTGGKTVVLKTIGLLALMVQSGLYIPANERSIFSVFNSIFIDIGDAQDIKHSLSTFSGHMKNIVEITNEAKPGSLVLLDEIGTGTDPREGAAIGAAVLEDLYKSGALSVVTTHYGELKDFSEKTKGFENAKMLFNPKTLEPYYKLVIGDSGESNALWISEELGLKKSVLKRAKELIGKDNNVKTFETKSMDYKKKKEKKIVEKKQYSKLYKGDLVLCLDNEEKAYVFEDVDDLGYVTVSRDYKFSKVHRKRLRLLKKAKDLYPEGYDLNQLFESFASRKLEKDISKGRFKNLKEIKDRINNLDS